MSTIFRGWLSGSVLGTLDAIMDNAICIVACTKVLGILQLESTLYFNASGTDCVRCGCRLPQSTLLFKNGARFRVRLDLLKRFHEKEWTRGLWRMRARSRRRRGDSPMIYKACRIIGRFTTRYKYVLGTRYWTLIKVAVHFPSVF